MNYSRIKITTKQAENILFDLFGIKGKANDLPGETDFNFRIKVKNSKGYILKISPPNENENYLDFLQKLLLHIEETGINLSTPKVIFDKNGGSISEAIDDHGNKRSVRLISWIEGRIWSSVNPQLEDLRFSLGQNCGKFIKALQDFKHGQSHRELLWDISQSLWTTNYLHLFSSKKKKS